MNRNIHIKWMTRSIRTLIFSLLVFLTACTPMIVVERPTSGVPSPTSQPTQDPRPIFTAAAQTIQAQTPTQAAATATLIPPTATQAEVEQPVATATLVEAGCQDAAQYIDDDGLDGTTYAPNTPFTKSWTLKNTGSCTWDSSYLVSYISGATMTQQPGYYILQQGQTVSPGQMVNIDIGMTSPPENGNYKSYWGLEKGDGNLMPIQGGANGNSFYAKIRVGDASEAAGKITTASIDIEPEQGSGKPCKANSTYFVHASLTADGPATASYEISSSAGQIAAGYFQDMENGSLSPTVSGTLVFDQADTKTIHLRFVGPYPYPDDITAILRVDGGEFYNARLSCQ